MRRALILLLLAGCGRDSAQAQARRGHEVFETTARTFAAGVFAETRGRDPATADKLVTAAGLKSDAEFVEMATRELLVRYGVVLALTEAQAAEFRAGRFDDEGNRKRVRETLAAFEKGKIPLPEVCAYAIRGVQNGAAAGLDLEFAARILWAEAMRPR
jgi:hypothetical protein